MLVSENLFLSAFHGTSSTMCFVLSYFLGAGQYSSKSIPLFEKLCRIACKKVLFFIHWLHLTFSDFLCFNVFLLFLQSIEVLNTGGSSLEAVTVATAILEDSELTNAGYGSNLTIDGYVECDASVMNGSDLNFGAVGAVSGVKNPVLLAKKICCNQNKPMELGRIPPRYNQNVLLVS